MEGTSRLTAHTRIAAALAALASSFCVGLACGRGASEGQVTVENASGKEIRELQVAVCNERMWSHGIPDGSAVGFSFPIAGQCEYVLEATFASGKRLDSRIGYLTREFDVSDTLVVGPEDVRLEGRK